MRTVNNLVDEEKIISNELFLTKLEALKGSRIYVQNMVKTNPMAKDICVATYYFTLKDVVDMEPYIVLVAKESKTDIRFVKEYITIQEKENSEFSITFVDENSFQIVNLFYNFDKFLDS